MTCIQRRVRPVKGEHNHVRCVPNSIRFHNVHLKVLINKFAFYLIKFYGFVLATHYTAAHYVEGTIL